MSIPIVDEDAERLRRRIQERASTLLSGPTRCDQAVLLLALSDVQAAWLDGDLGRAERLLAALDASGETRGCHCQ